MCVDCVMNSEVRCWRNKEAGTDKHSPERWFVDGLLSVHPRISRGDFARYINPWDN